MIKELLKPVIERKMPWWSIRAIHNAYQPKNFAMSVE
ncbi:hypothetical protein QF028_005988 [Neobacillus sp. B4I6]